MKKNFRKKYFLGRTMPKNSKRGHSDSLNVFTNRKLQKMQGGTLIESENFRKKSSIVPKKNQTKKRNEKTFGLASTFGSIKKFVV